MGEIPVVAKPTNSDWTQRDALVLANVMQRTTDPVFGPVIVRGQGSYVWDAEDRQFLDLTCGYSAANFGHAFPPLLDVARQQLQRLTHVTGMPHPGRTELAERLIRTCGRPGLDKVLFNSSGSRAIESAWKAAVCFRPGIVASISPAFHGRSISTMSLSDTARIGRLQRPKSEVIRRPPEEFAYCTACPLSLRYPSCDVACQRSLLDWLERDADQISALFVEPALGARGYIAPPAEYWQRIRKATERAGVLLIADEVQIGLGRAGHWLLSRSQGWQADMVILGKSLGGGIVPISAVVGRADILDALPPGTESETFSASPLATAIACEVHHQLESGPWMQRALQLGQSLQEILAKSAACSGKEHLPASIETCGASATLEFYRCWSELARATSEARRFAQRLLAAGLITHYGGPYGTRISFLPALTIGDDEMEEVRHRCLAA